MFYVIQCGETILNLIEYNYFDKECIKIYLINNL